MTRSLQMEWSYLQRVLPGLSAEFGPVEEAITKDFLPALFEGGAEMDPLFRSITALPVRHSGLGVFRPTKTAVPNYDASVILTKELTRSILQGRNLDTVQYLKNAARERKNLTAERDGHLGSASGKIASKLTKVDAQRFRRGEETGAWLTVQPCLLNGTDLSSEELRDGLSLRYGLAAIGASPWSMRSIAKREGSSPSATKS